MMVARKKMHTMSVRHVNRQSRLVGFEKMSQAIGLSVCWLDRNGNIRHYNQKFERLVGLSSDELKNKQIFQLSFQLTYFKLREIWLSLEEENYLEWEDEFLLKDCTQKVNIHSWIVETEEDDMLCCIVKKEDSQSKLVRLKPNVNAKPMLEPLQDFARMVVDKTNALIFWIESDFSIKYMNERAKLMLEYDLENHMEYGSFLDLDKTFARQNWHEIQRGLEGKRCLELEGAMMSRLGNAFPVEYYLFRSEPENTSSLCVIARDITEKRKQENKLRNALTTVESLTQKLTTENIYLKEEINNFNKFDNIISESKNYQKVLRKVAQVAPTDSTVLILGETGTGKELIAKAVHKLSDRNEKPFLKVNCAALPRDVIESELFGHEKGAFTGAFETRIGRFEAANGGTLFLDEIGEIPLELQTKLLRVLQEQEFERIGSNRPIAVNVRIIAATNKDLQAMVEEGTFRQDLYYRLNVFPIYNIPLRERKEDIAPLIRHFIKKYNRQMGKNVTTFTEADLKRIKSYSFPGNIRELENIIERAIILTNGEKLNLADWHLPKSEKKENMVGSASFDELQRMCILAALEKTNWKIGGHGAAAELLGLSERVLHTKMEQYGIKIPQIH